MAESKPSHHAPLSSSAQRFQDSLHQLGLERKVIEHSQTTRSAKEAAEAIGCSVAQIAKSLVFRTRETHRPILVIASGPNRVDEAKIGARAGEALEKADASFVLEATGYAIGGVPPVGHKTRLETYIDEDLLALEEIWAAAGTPNAVFCLSPDELLDISGGIPAAVK